jgi:hypothetical protein
MKLEPKRCLICEERILQTQETQETCEDYICKALHLFVLSAYSAEIRRCFKKITRAAQAA